MKWSKKSASNDLEIDFVRLRLELEYLHLLLCKLVQNASIAKLVSCWEKSHLFSPDLFLRSLDSLSAEPSPTK